MREYFTDASYSSQTGVGVVATMEVIDGERRAAIVTEHRGIDSFMLEKLGIARCVLSADGRPATIYTDCLGAIYDHYGDHIQVVWIPGHVRPSNRSPIDRLFSSMDRLARREMHRISRRIASSSSSQEQEPMLLSRTLPASPRAFGVTN